MMNSIDDINVTSYGIHVLLLSIFHLVVKVGGCVAEENNFNMNMITYGLVHYNLDNRLLKRSSTSTGGAQFAFFHHPHISEFLSNITMSGCGTFSTSRYSDVVATSIVVISDLDFRFSGIEFLIFNCVARRHA
jgi:hypothetical protein